jgi:hypothetical protein
MAVPFSGIVTLGDRKLEFDGAPGSQSHRWGARHSVNWTWAHCSDWDRGEGVFEGLSAQAALGPVTAPTSTFVFLRYAGEDIAFNELKWAVRAKSEYDLPIWTFTAHTDRWKIYGTALARPEQMVQVTYRDPDGSKRYCANSEVSDMRIHVFRKDETGWTHAETLGTRGGAHLEFGRKDPFPGIPIAF